MWELLQAVPQALQQVFLAAALLPHMLRDPVRAGAAAGLLVHSLASSVLHTMLHWIVSPCACTSASPASRVTSWPGSPLHPASVLLVVPAGLHGTHADEQPGQPGADGCAAAPGAAGGEGAGGAAGPGQCGGLGPESGCPGWLRSVVGKLGYLLVPQLAFLHHVSSLSGAMGPPARADTQGRLRDCLPG